MSTTRTRQSRRPSQLMETEGLSGLNETQVEAVQAVDGPVLVLAGPGSGKTRVLTHRVAHIIRNRGVPPYNILAVTFTNKAAKEMIGRLHSLIGTDTSRLTVGTFHATCARILRREAPSIGLAKSFVIYDSDDQRRLIIQVIKELGLETSAYRPAAVRAAISRAKNELITASTYVPPTYWHEGVARIFERYEKLKAENSALDFDDLLQKAEELLREHDLVRAQYQDRFRYILVDEFQDTNRAQYDMIGHLAGPLRNVFVVGDEDQSIYSWRGADFRNVVRFRSDYPDAKVLLLEQNYRSTGTILSAAQAVIARNTQRTAKRLWTQNEAGRLIHLFEAYDEREEAECVVSELQRLVSRGECTYGECAVMFRTNSQSRAIEDAFVRHGLAYKLVGATRFYQRREIKDVLSYLRLAYNPDDEIALSRVINVPGRGIGRTTMAQLGEWAHGMGLSLGGALLHFAQQVKDRGKMQGAPFSTRARRLLLTFGQMLAGFVEALERLSLSQLLELVLDRTAYLKHLEDGTEEGQDRANNVRELFSATERFDQTPLETALPLFLEETALISEVDELDWQSEAVTLLTLHSAKGLEFDTVFIVGMEDGICPHSRSMDSPDQMEEERRLCYVGITRAKQRLYLVRTFRRTLYGNSETRQPSRFLEDIPPQLLEGHVVREKPSFQASSYEDGQTSRRALFSDRRSRVQRDIALSRIDEPSAAQPARGRGTMRPPNLPSNPEANTDSTWVRPTGPSFHPGESVIHSVFGSGTVISSQVVGDDEEVTVAFEGRGVKRLMASYAKLARQ